MSERTYTMREIYSAITCSDKEFLQELGVYALDMGAQACMGMAEDLKSQIPDENDIRSHTALFMAGCIKDAAQQLNDWFNCVEFNARAIFDVRVVTRNRDWA